MCTVTVVPYGGGFRVMCNRDERRTRPAALPPRIQRVGTRVAAFPLDPLGGGTWIGVNDAGLVLTLLNRQRVLPSVRRIARPRSRGFLVRMLLDQGSSAAAVQALSRFDVTEFDPFSLVAIDASHVRVANSDGVDLGFANAPLAAPMLFTSSSLGDALVEAPRQRLFERMVVRQRRGWLEAQARFHRHQWRARPEISVRMARVDALTVSETVVDVSAEGHRLAYESLLPGARWQRRRRCYFFR